ncbi:MAG: peptidase S41 [Clostridiales bacterium]|nr:MAG: peptidase S41 [Clostridiales bacterium]
MNKKYKFLSIILAFVIFFLGFGVGKYSDVDKIDVKDNSSDKSERYKKLDYLEKFIRNNYYEGDSNINFDEGLYRGLFEAIGDKYSRYYTKEEFENFSSQLRGEFTGIGVNIEPRENGMIRISSAIEGTPAFEAGLQAGDMIFKVDDKLVEDDESHNATVSRITGEKGTKVKIYVYRTNKDTLQREELSFDIIRDTITVPPVKSRMESDAIGYLKIVEFDEGVAGEFKKHLKDLMDQGMKYLILDLRDNPGGDLGECVEIADEILPTGTVVSLEGPTIDREDYTSDEVNKLEIPYVVLINENSASASEILSGAIKDFDTAKIFGTKSFGKGIVQSVINYFDGSGFTLTTSYYLTPNGNKITKENPVVPDVNMEEVEEKGYETTYKSNGLIEKDGLLDFAKDYLLGKIDI